MTKKSIYAVLAGINEYPPPVTPLRGCLHDVESWEQFLKKEEPEHKLKIQILKNEKVTKKALTKALDKSLSSAKDGDVVFFFYSGHGTRETADPAFDMIEQDKALESLVCHDSVRYTQGNIEYDLLSDKEIHYLLSTHVKEGVHVLMVFDCCHSGGITRNMSVPEMEDGTLERRYRATERMSFIAPMRPWDKFIFAKEVSQALVEKQGWMTTVPQQPHLTFSACQNDESAFEYQGKGIFTANLIDVLERSGRALSYYDLQSRVRAFTQNQFRQTPEIYAIRGHEDDLLHTFLNKAIVQKDLGCTCYHQTDMGWVIDLGTIHGVSSYSGPVQISDSDESLIASVGQILPNLTQLVMPETTKARLDPKQAYRALLVSHFSGNTTFFIGTSKSAATAVLKDLKHAVTEYLDDTGGPFAIAKRRAHAGYVVKLSDDKLHICNNDDSLRPVTEVPLGDPEVIGKTLQYMRHISQWEYLRLLSNPEFIAKEYPVKFNLYREFANGTRKEIYLNGDTIEFDYDQDAQMHASGKLKVQITNTGSVKYYCAILYFSNEFQIYGNMLDGKVIGLNPSEVAWIYNGDVIELDLEQHIVDFNYPHSVFYLKLLANPDPFQVDVLEQSPLPAPAKRTRRSADEISKGMKTREEKAVKNVKWFTRTLCFKGRNPFYVESEV